MNGKVDVPEWATYAEETKLPLSAGHPTKDQQMSKETGGEPVALLAELDAERQKNELLKAAVLGADRYIDPLRIEPFRLRYIEAIKIAEGS